VRFPPWGGEGWGFANYPGNYLIPANMAAKPLPATAQPATPLPMGGSFAANITSQVRLQFLNQRLIVSQSRQRLVFDLSYPFPGKVIFITDLVQAQRLPGS
jgi:hypothetical protein